MTGIITTGYKQKVIEVIRNDISNTASSSYYVAFGRIDLWPDDMNPPAPNTSVQAQVYELQRDFIFGKRVNISDTAYMINKSLWTANTVYASYSHLDPDLDTKNFYVINNSNRVYKCLDNNYGAPSTIQPTSTNFLGDFTTSDGYTWKYMYNISARLNSKFTSNDLVAVETNTNVSGFAEPGAIHSVLVKSGGSGYITANGFVDQVLSSLVFKISNTNSIGVSGAYTGSFLSTTSAISSTNPADYIVVDYTVNAYGRFITTNGPVGLVSGDYYSISPRIDFIGDGSGAYGYASVNSVSGSIKSVKVVNRGSNYSFANTVVVANTNYGIGADVYAILPPPGGHGNNAIAELYSKTLGISIETNVSDSLPDWISYRQVGLLNNPIAFSNNAIYKDNIFYQVYTITVTNVSALFNVGETVIGRTSGATGIVANMTTTELNLINVQGNFAQNETVASVATGLICTASTINNIDLVKNSGNVLYFKNFEPIARAGVSSEKVKIYITV